jgi:hypothetical protein
MAHSLSPVALTEALVRANQHWQLRSQGEGAAPGQPTSSAFTIALSREAGTYGAAIAREAAVRLGWPVYDRELLQRIANAITANHPEAVLIVLLIDERYCWTKRQGCTNTHRLVLDRRQFDRATLVCDIEGMEIDLWRHEADIVAERIGCLIVELHEPISGREAVQAFLDGVRSRGFALVWERSWTRVFRNTRWTVA